MSWCDSLGVVEPWFVSRCGTLVFLLGRWHRQCLACVPIMTAVTVMRAYCVKGAKWVYNTHAESVFIHIVTWVLVRIDLGGILSDIIYVYRHSVCLIFVIMIDTSEGLEIFNMLA